MLEDVKRRRAKLQVEMMGMSFRPEELYKDIRRRRGELSSFEVGVEFMRAEKDQGQCNYLRGAQGTVESRGGRMWSASRCCERRGRPP